MQLQCALCQLCIVPGRMASHVRYRHKVTRWCFDHPGGRLISLNKTSLEGVTFSDAAAILQSSPDEVELIVSQPKRTTPLASYSSR